MTCHLLETELTERLAERETLRDRVRELRATAPINCYTAQSEIAHLAEQIANLSGRIAYLRCMR